MRTTKITIELVNLLQETLKHREIRIANLESTVTELSEMAVKLLNSIVDPDQAIDEETLKRNCLRIIDLQNQSISNYESIIKSTEQKLKDLSDGK